MNEQVSAWLTAVDGLAAVYQWLRQVLVLNRPALEVIRAYDVPETLFYLDPPYLHETRKANNIYAPEMTAEQHAELLEVINGASGKVMLSGYRSEMYDAALSSWRRYEFDQANQAAGGSSKRRMTECLCLNWRE
jgi:DNA adenine methylase